MDRVDDYLKELRKTIAPYGEEVKTCSVDLAGRERRQPDGGWIRRVPRRGAAVPGGRPGGPPPARPP
jgi:hypothetical protein